MKLLKMYEEVAQKQTDISQALPILRGLASIVDHVTEFGMREGNSTTALMAGLPRVLITYDHRAVPLKPLVEAAAEARVEFIITRQNVLEAAPIEETDLLFIDTLHTFDQLTKELKIHGSRATRFIAFHDTHTFGKTCQGKKGGEGLLPAIGNFLKANRKWRLLYHTVKENGFTVIGRQSCEWLEKYPNNIV